MKLRLIALIAGTMMLSQPAASAPWGFVLALQGQEQQLQPHEPEQSGRREMRREQRRMAQERDERPRHRLTDDERRNLRRDIDQADREIYRRDRRR